MLPTLEAVELGKSARSLLLGDPKTPSAVSPPSTRLKVAGALAIASARIRLVSERSGRGHHHNPHADTIVQLLREAIQRSAPPLYQHADVVTGEQNLRSRVLVIMILVSIPVHFAFDAVAALGIWGAQPDGSMAPWRIIPFMLCLLPINVLHFVSVLSAFKDWDNAWVMTSAIVGEAATDLSSFEAEPTKSHHSHRRRRGVNLPKLRWLATAEHADLVRRAADTITANAWKPLILMICSFFPLYMIFIAVPGIDGFAGHYGLEPGGAAVWAMYSGSALAVVMFNWGTSIHMGPNLLMAGLNISPASSFVETLDAVVLPKLGAELATHDVEAGRDDRDGPDGDGGAAASAVHVAAATHAWSGDVPTITTATTGDQGVDVDSSEDFSEVRELYDKYVQVRRVAAAMRRVAPIIVLAPAAHAMTVIAGTYALLSVTPRYNVFLAVGLSIFVVSLPGTFALAVVHNSAMRRGRRRLAELRLMAGSLNASVLGAALDRFARVLVDDSESGGGIMRAFGIPISNTLVVSVCSGVATVAWLLMQPRITAELV